MSTSRQVVKNGQNLVHIVFERPLFDTRRKLRMFHQKLFYPSVNTLLHNSDRVHCERTISTGVKFFRKQHLNYSNLTVISRDIYELLRLIHGLLNSTKGINNVQFQGRQGGPKWLRKIGLYSVKYCRIWLVGGSKIVGRYLWTFPKRNS